MLFDIMADASLVRARTFLKCLLVLELSRQPHDGLIIVFF